MYFIIFIGHLWDKNLFESKSVLPSTYRRINDDMSQAPAPYRVTRNMLVSPGDIVSYEYYRIRPDDIDYGKCVLLTWSDAPIFTCIIDLMCQRLIHHCCHIYHC